MVNKARVHGELVFVSSTYQCHYIGTWAWQQPQWLKDNPDKWRYLEDVLREEAASPPPPAESKIALGTGPAVPNDQTSSHVTQDNGNNEDDVARVDTLVGDRSPSDEPTLLPTPVTATVESETKTPKLQRSADATASEVEGPKSETAPLGSKDHKRGRSGGRQIKKKKQISKAQQKRLAERVRLMRIVLDSLSEKPILSDAAKKAGVYPKTPAYWKKRSEAGDPRYVIEWHGEELYFHEHYQTAIEEAHDKVLAAARDMTKEVVVYKTDPMLLDLGYEGPDAYLRDENGYPVPDTVRHAKPKMVRLVLVRLRPEKFGKDRKIDVPHQGGVLVVGGNHDIPKKVNKGPAASVKARQWKAEWRMVQEEKNNTDG